jgi:hypothetical protein
MGNRSHYEQFRPLGSPDGTEYGPMRTVAGSSAHWELADSGGFADLLVSRGSRRNRLELLRPAGIGSLWLGYIAAGLKPFTLPGCSDLGQDCLLRIVTFPNAAQTPSMAVLPLSLAEDSANRPPWMACGASVLPPDWRPFSRLRLEHCELALHERVAIARRQVHDFARVHRKSDVCETVSAVGGNAALTSFVIVLKSDIKQSPSYAVPAHPSRGDASK